MKTFVNRGLGQKSNLIERSSDENNSSYHADWLARKLLSSSESQIRIKTCKREFPAPCQLNNLRGVP